MNRFLIITVFFCLVFIMVSCGTNTGTENKDTGNTQTDIDYDTGNTDDADDTDDTDDTGWVADEYVVVCNDVECQIPAGEFQMGCNLVNTECYYNELPYHPVTLSAYKIDKYEVTAGEYQRCVDAGDCDDSSYYRKYSEDSYCNLGAVGKSKHPMNCVTWFGAKTYCGWAGKRLPTEAEWEKAARGTDGRIYPWGNGKATCEYAVMNDSETAINGCGTDSTWTVGSKEKGKSPYGAYDMAGNVNEWVNDWYEETYYETSPSENPAGPEMGSLHVLRGGAWIQYDLLVYDYLSSSHRNIGTLDSRGSNIGFRCAKDDTGTDNNFPNEHDGLDWSDASSETMNWYDSIKYCEELGGRLPTISELRTLIQNCPGTEKGVACGVNEDCLSWDDCQNDACYGCNCDYSGKYSAFGDKGWLWSSSELSDNPNSAWLLYFDHGSMSSSTKDDNFGYNVRCVRKQIRQFKAAGGRFALRKPEVLCHKGTDLGIGFVTSEVL